MEQKLTLDQIREKYIGAVNKKFPGAKIEENSDTELTINFSNGISLGSYLGNLFDEIKNKPKDVDDIIKNRMVILDDIYKKMPTGKGIGLDKKMFSENAILCVKSKGYAELTELTDEEKKAQNELVRKPFTKHLDLVMAIDHERMIMFVSKQMIKECKLTEEQAWELAIKNTDNKKWRNEVKKMEDGSVFVFSTDEMQHTLCSPKHMKKIVKGKKMIAVIPFRDYIIMREHTGKLEQDAGTYLSMWTQTKAMIDDKIRNHPVSSKPFIINEDGTLEDFKFLVPDPKKKGEFIEIDEGQIMAIQVDKKTGEQKVMGMMNIGGDSNANGKNATTSRSQENN